MHEDALAAIQRVYNDSEALIYVDPPYVGHEDEYRYRVDYPAMVELLNSASAKVIVSESPAADVFYPHWNRIERTHPAGGLRAPGRVQQQGRDSLHQLLRPAAMTKRNQLLGFEVNQHHCQRQ